MWRELEWSQERISLPQWTGDEFAGGEGRLTNEVPADYVFVDGLGVGDVSEVVLRDRQLKPKTACLLCHQ